MMHALEAIRTRRSLRQLDRRPVPRALIDEALALACLAPAPHHTRPWRYVVVGSERRSPPAERVGPAWPAGRCVVADHRAIVCGAALIVRRRSRWSEMSA